MENYPVIISDDKEVHYFEIGEYLHHDGESCKFRVFEKGNYVAGFVPGRHGFLQVCQNPGGIKEEVLNLLADHIEAHMQ